MQNARLESRLPGEISITSDTQMMPPLWHKAKKNFPGGSDGKASVYNVGDLGSILGLGRPLEKGKATYSSILAWRIPWTEELGGLQSTGS